MSRPRKTKKKNTTIGPALKKPRRYHLVDDDPCYFETGENPDWLVGSN